MQQNVADAHPHRRACRVLGRNGWPHRETLVASQQCPCNYSQWSKLMIVVAESLIHSKQCPRRTRILAHVCGVLAGRDNAARKSNSREHHMTRAREAGWLDLIAIGCILTSYPVFSPL